MRYSEFLCVNPVQFAPKSFARLASCTLMKQVLRLGRLPRAERSKRGWSRAQVELAAESSRVTLSVVAVHVSHSKLWLTLASPALCGCQVGGGQLKAVQLCQCLGEVGDTIVLYMWGCCAGCDAAEVWRIMTVTAAAFVSVKLIVFCFF